LGACIETISDTDTGLCIAVAIESVLYRTGSCGAKCQLSATYMSAARGVSKTQSEARAQWCRALSAAIRAGMLDRATQVEIGPQEALGAVLAKVRYRA
jgi:hypothetical protein